MKAASTAVKTLLATRQFWACDLYTLTLANGTVLRFAGGDCDVQDSQGNVYACGGMSGPYWGLKDDQAQIHSSLGTGVDTVTIGVLPGAATIFGMPYLQAVALNIFDGALLRIEQALAPAPPAAACWPAPITGTVFAFLGTVAEVDGGNTGLTFTVNSALERLQSKLPRVVYSSTCANSFGDAGCGVAKWAWALYGMVRDGSDQWTIRATFANGDGSSASPPTGWFDQGGVGFSSGTNAAGIGWRSVDTWRTGSPGTLILSTSLPFAPVAGDRFMALPGCKGDAGSCAKFDNLDNFRGFPFIPAPTTAA